MNIGNKLNSIVYDARSALFRQGEVATLTSIAFEEIVKSINERQEEELTFSYPIGFKPDKTPLLNDKAYFKKDLIDKYRSLANEQLAINSIYQILTIIEAMLSDVTREIILRYPNKIGGNKQVSTKAILKSGSLTEIHLHVVNKILNELSYKSPKDYAKDVEDYLSINLLECNVFEKYVEIKATRDIYIHNRGIVNEVYIEKTRSHSRAKIGQRLPVDVNYFMESYEICLSFTEWLEKEFHEKWHSSDYEERINKPEISEDEVLKKKLVDTFSKINK